VVEAALRGGALSLTSLGRALAGTAYVKHKIKRVDRLLGNRKLAAERGKIYGALTRWLIGTQTQPVIVIDWSDLSADRRWHLLRAAAPMRGRSLTLYEEVHPLCRLANPQVQRRFLLRLRALLPASCTPIIVTDAGFRAPWFRLVQTLGWQFVGRVRNRDFVRSAGSPDWMPSKSLYVRAHRRAQALGSFELVRARPLACALWLIRQPRTIGCTARVSARLPAAPTASNAPLANASRGCWPVPPLSARFLRLRSLFGIGCACRSKKASGI
jgi:hypothetical protein